jgi:hypothetical protein
LSSPAVITSVAFSVWITADCGTRKTPSQLAGEQPDADELAGQQALFRVVELGAQALGAERGVDVGGEEVDPARLFIDAAVGQHQLDALDVLRGDAAAGEAGEVALAEREADPDRVGLVDRGQQAVAAGDDQVAFRLRCAAGGAGDRRGDRRPRQVQFGLAQRGLGQRVGRQRVVVVLARDRLGLGQPLQTVRLARRLLGLGLGFGQRDLVGRAVDLEQRLAGLDRLAFLVEALDDDAADAGADFGLAGAFGLRHDFDRGRDALRLHLENGHRQRPHGRGGGFLAGAAGEQQRTAQRGRRDQGGDFAPGRKVGHGVASP